MAGGAARGGGERAPVAQADGDAAPRLLRELMGNAGSTTILTRGTSAATPASRTGPSSKSSMPTRPRPSAAAAQYGIENFRSSAFVGAG
jgi:hypothetical protein